jgi:hypothetical protein
MTGIKYELPRQIGMRLKAGPESSPSVFCNKPW